MQHGEQSNINHFLEISDPQYDAGQFMHSYIPGNGEFLCNTVLKLHSKCNSEVFNCIEGLFYIVKFKGFFWWCNCLEN